ncbi:MAG TPA: TetR/AcrR family transcriptional regulator [Sunxiuqinia sp.]|nr:TetR/AcrR family transcriptional regulator [Sunxiuqinia sp.]
MQDKRQAILDTALKLFVDQGFHATPTAKIAKESKVATGTLFHHFKTKEDLINTLYLATKDEMIREIASDVDQQASVKAKLRQIFFNVVRWSLQFPYHHAFYYQYSYSPFISQITKELGEQRLQFIYNMLEEGKQNDVLKSVPTDLLFESALGQINGIIKCILENPDKFDDEAYMEHAFTLCWDAMRG